MKIRRSLSSAISTKEIFLNTDKVIREVVIRSKIQKILKKLLIEEKNLKVVLSHLYQNTFMHSGDHLSFYISESIFLKALQFFMNYFGKFSYYD
jgi:hypothetical protein